MKKVVMASILLFFGVISYASGAELDVPHVSVAGTAKVMVKPDQMTWWIQYGI